MATIKALILSLMTQLRITEIFYSLQGESETVGLPTVFVRLTGCPLRCQYCDTAYAFKGGTMYTLEGIMAQVNHYHTPYVTVTGGEPLAQPHCITLLTALCDAGKQVSLETSGAMDVSQVDERVVKVVDIKTPGSKEEHRNRWENMEYLKVKDQLKFVLCGEEDYQWSKAIIADHKLEGRCQLLFSPSYGQLDPQTLANWILKDQLLVRFQLQLHKVLWNDEPGR